MTIQSVFDESFLQYGQIVTGHDTAALLDTLRAQTPRPSDSVVYVPGDEALEALPIHRALQDNVYGGMPIQIGYCNGHNKALNCLEYHRDSEINIPADDMIFLVAQQSKIRNGKLDTSEVEAFLAPAGTVVELYATTLHYAPYTAPGGDGFQVIVVLPKGTNTEKPEFTPRNAEDNLLRARNKWLLAHPEAPEAAQGAHIGLTGENITI